MEVSTHNKNAIFFVVLLTTLTTLAQGQGTRVGFYSTSCPTAETIVRSAVQSAFQTDATVAPGLLRVHFHDCFVNGCDASILIDGANTEKTAGPNLLLRGFNVIDAAKTQLESTCPGVVSCADIVALAARDSVVLTGGLNWQVPTGRRDGLVSRAADAANLPGANEPLNTLITKFSDKGLNIQDLVALSGGHTIGTASCGTFSYRLYNYNNTNAPDPSINASFLAQLQNQCPNGGSGSTRVAMDTGSVNNFDSSYFANLRNGRGVLESDQVLWTDPRTSPIVQRFLAFSAFRVEFGRSMVKMSNIGVNTGTQGEIRRVCTATN